MSPDDLPQPLPGKYRFVSILGTGAMGVVHRAEQLDAEGRPLREVAVKTIQPALSADPSFAQRFLREIRLTAQLRSGHVVIVHDAGRAPDGALYYSMELVRGETLQSLLAREGPLPAGRAIAIGRQICDALAEAHDPARPIVHRDLKPANVFVEQRAGRDLVKVADFGIAKGLQEETTGLTAAGSSPGTPRYMAPEQWRGEGVEVRADLYSFGVMLFEMLAGHPPFSGSVETLMYKHLHAAPPVLPENVPPALATLVAALLEKEPVKRPADAADVERALAESLGAAESFGTARTTLVGGPPQKRGWPILPAAGAAAALAAAAVVFVATRHSGAPAPVLALRPPETAKPVDPTPPPAPTLAPTLAPAPSPAPKPTAAPPAAKSPTAAPRVREEEIRAWSRNGDAAFFGRGAPKDLAAARSWYEKAAENGDANAEQKLGAIYRRGLGVTADAALGLRWTTKAARQGNAVAEHALGIDYALGRGTAADPAQAALWLRKSAEQGNADGEAGLGLAYAKGIGVPQDWRQAFAWRTRAAAQGQVHAMRGLAFQYTHGFGVRQDAGEAQRWRREAERRRNEAAEESERGSDGDD